MILQGIITFSIILFLGVSFLVLKKKKRGRMQGISDKEYHVFDTMIGVGVVVVDLNKKMLFVNDKAAETLRLKKKSIIGKEFHGTFRLENELEEEIKENESAFDKIWKTGAPISAEITKLKVGEEEKIILLGNYELLHDEKGKIKGGIFVFQDITRIKESEEKFRNFISIATHEFATPITIISGNLSVVLNEGLFNIDKEKSKTFLEQAQEGCKRLQRVFRSLVYVSRFESINESRTFAKVDISKVAEEVNAELKLFADQKGLKIKVKTKTSKKVMCDANLIKEALINLVENAIKYSKKGCVEIEITEGKEIVTISVKDNGQGISESKLPSLFKRFDQIDASFTREEGGMGFGLFIIKSIVDLHNGNIWVESKKGEGSKFTFSLPKDIGQSIEK